MRHLLVFLLVFLLFGCSAQTPAPETATTTEITAPASTEAAVCTTEETAPRIGWQETDGERYFLLEDGSRATGWLSLEAEEVTYYLDENGHPHTGWLTLEGNTYYFLPDGTMAKGEVEIEGSRYHFTSTGNRVILVNPHNYIPEDYQPELVKLSTKYGVEGSKVDQSCYDALIAMLDDCNRECPKAYVVSSYRTQEYQAKNYARKVSRLKAKGYDEQTAKTEAAKVVAVPGTSEHQLGLAVDIIDTRLWNLVEEQADLPAQKWLMENSWRYGFVLRYPKEKQDITGIIYEPWHYRYVGTELAKELYDFGLTLEEYIAALTE